MKVNAALVKSYLRSFGVALAMAIVTFVGKGGKLGANKETVVAIGATLLLPLLPVAQRYFDKTDPAFGAVAKLAIEKADSVLVPLSTPSVTAEAPNTQSTGA